MAGTGAFDKKVRSLDFGGNGFDGGEPGHSLATAIWLFMLARPTAARSRDTREDSADTVKLSRGTQHEGLLGFLTFVAMWVIRGLQSMLLCYCCCAAHKILGCRQEVARR